MDETKECTSCHAETDVLEIFPGGVCLNCWAKSQEDQPLPTAEEMAEMWKKSVR